MEIGLGVDAGAGLTFAEHRDVARTAARRGYESCWTPSGVGQDAFQVCTQWVSANKRWVKLPAVEAPPAAANSDPSHR